jgi:uncharacterized DUF497 family protein
MKISYDQAKRDKTLAERGLDFADFGNVLNGKHFTLEDDRLDYGETRFITIGYLDHRMVVCVWTSREDGIRVISMRKANEREQAKYEQHLD